MGGKRNGEIIAIGDLLGYYGKELDVTNKCRTS